MTVPKTATYAPWDSPWKETVRKQGRRPQDTIRKGNKTIEVNKTLERYKVRAKEKLTSPEGIEKRKQRATDVEPVFGQLKQNMGMKRYVLRGIEKVGIETGLRMIAHNLAKKARKSA